MSANVIDCHLANINNDISSNQYFKHAKTATVRPIFKKDDRTNIKNYRPVSLLNIFSKIYERFLHENLTSYLEIFLSKFISAYRKSYSSNHVFNSLNRKLKKIFRSEKICRSGINRLIKSFWFHTSRSLDSKNACLWFLIRCCYILLFVFKKTKTKCEDKQYT